MTKVHSKPEDVVFLDSKKKQKIDVDASWNEEGSPSHSTHSSHSNTHSLSQERKSHKKRHSVSTVQHFPEERKNIQIEPCSFVHNLTHSGDVSELLPLHLPASSSQEKGQCFLSPSFSSVLSLFLSLSFTLTLSLTQYFPVFLNSFLQFCTIFSEGQKGRKEKCSATKSGHILDPLSCVFLAYLWPLVMIRSLFESVGEKEG